MAKKIIYSTEQDVPEMNLTEKEKKELNQAWKEIMDDAKKVSCSGFAKAIISNM